MDSHVEVACNSLLLKPCCSYMPCPDQIKDNVNQEVIDKTPILFCHGTADPMVKMDWGKKSMEYLKELGADTRWKTYPGMEHSACVEEFQDVVAFVQDTLPPLTR